MTAKIKNLWYNPAESAFEGRVDVAKGAATYRYPCTVSGPMTMSRKIVKDRMVAQAKRMSDSPGGIYSVI
ncbi:orotidine 5'-phosphate decarboxylase [Yoonia litorea]|uniref:Uncharacterized protein n=1 Tax=Yoonia litorea TaxID=1123755 RepID=A0A1I6N044_9RHOB|nr:orotidine 5'-phosphate decarboxylase [Yoonia litorea]SFS21332.1 hypothetical protein SAMN05444714_2802 [Yoonia litorea]